MVDFRTLYREKANIAYMVIGYPNMNVSREFLESLDESPIDILEVGVAYSDPIADGEVIANAALKAIEQGANIHEVFKLLREIKTQKALVFMVYYNLIFSYGLARFVREAKKVGICALIVPELSFEESTELRKECDKEGLALITLISITTPKERIARLVKGAKGFIYLLASIGITGGKSAGKELLETKIKELRSLTKLPIFVGFGIKNNEDVKNIREICDGVIVGTSIVELFKSTDTREILEGVKEIFKS